MSLHLKDGIRVIVDWMRNQCRLHRLSQDKILLYFKLSITFEILIWLLLETLVPKVHLHLSLGTFMVRK
jgi:hypothetical protein